MFAVTNCIAEILDIDILQLNIFFVHRVSGVNRITHRMHVEQ